VLPVLLSYWKGMCDQKAVKNYLEDVIGVRCGMEAATRRKRRINKPATRRDRILAYADVILPHSDDTHESIHHISGEQPIKDLH